MVNRRDPGDLGRSEGVLRERDQVVRVQDDVDLLAVQLAHDGLHAAAPHPHARADGVHVALPRAHGDLGPLARLAHSALDDDRPVVDLRDFHLEEADQESRVGPRQDELRPLGVAVHVEAVRIREHVLVAVGRRVDHRQLLARPDVLPAHDGVGGGGASEVVERVRPAQDLLDRRRNERGILLQPPHLLGVLHERERAVGDRVPGRLVAGDHQQREVRMELVL